jgi:Ca-activated chloride channel family protein
VSFQQPLILLLLVPVAALVGGYIFLQQRRRHYAVRFTNLELLSTVAPQRPGWRRHVPAAAVGASLLALTVGLAQPVHETRVANESKIVMLDIDVSRSMEATDVAPSRLKAATDAAQEFVRGLPRGYQVGLVSFSTTANILVSPTDDHDQVVKAIGELQPEASTATGDAVMASLQAIESARAAAGVESGASGEAKSATIVMLSDGAQKVGTPLSEAASAAATAGVPISTITFGTPTGVVTVPGGAVVPVPPDPQAMAELAKTTGGRAFDAASADQLKEVYAEIQSDVGYTLQASDLWPWFVGVGLLLLMAASLAGLVWSGRFL